MTEQTARERVDSVMNEYWLSMCKCITTGEMSYGKEDAATDILHHIRTALLSEPAVDAAMAVIEYRSQEQTAAQDWKEERDDWKEALSAAWDSVIGGTDGTSSN